MATNSIDSSIGAVAGTAEDLSNHNVPINQPDSDSVILRCNQTLKLETAIEILNNTDQHKVINKVPENPKGGDTYLLIPAQKDDGKCYFFHFYQLLFLLYLLQVIFSNGRKPFTLG